MRAAYVLIASLALVLGGCSRERSHAPPPLDKTLLAGKWKNTSDVQFLAGYDFNADGTLAMTFRGMKGPISGRFTWAGERTIELDYSSETSVQKAYEAAVKAFKDDVNNRVKKKELDGRAGNGMIAVVADKLPAKESFKVGIADPRFLVLTRGDGSTLNFDKVD